MKKLIIPKQTIAKEDITVSQIDPEIAKGEDGVDPIAVDNFPTVNKEDDVIFDEALITSIEPEENDVQSCEVGSYSPAIEEMQEALNDELQENDKVSDIAETLHDIADTIEDSPSEELTETEKQLIVSSANMAVSGTDEDASLIAPSLESFADKAMIISELRKKHQIANEGIADSFQQIFTKFAEFIKGLFSFTAKIEYRLRDAKKAVASLKAAKQKQIEIQFKKSPYLLKNMTEYVSSYEEYLETLKSTVEFFGKFAPLASNSVGDFKGAIFEYWTTVPGSEKTFEAAAGLYKKYIENFVEGTKKLPGMKKVDSKIPHVDMYSSIPLLGGFSVYVADYNQRAEAHEDNIIEMKNTINNSYVVFSKDYLPLINGKNSVDSNKVGFTVDIKMLEDTLSEVEKALKVFKVFLNDAYKSFTKVAAVRNIKMEWNGKLLSLHSFIINRGINNSNFYVGYAKQYSKILCFAPLDVVNKITSSSKWERE